MTPQHVAIRGTGAENSLCTLEINRAGLRIDRRARSRVAQVNGIAQVVIIELLPQFFASRRIKTGKPLLQIRTGAEVTHRVEFSIRNYRSRLTREIRDPDGVLG